MKNKFFKPLKMEEFKRSPDWRNDIAFQQNTLAESMLNKLEDNINCPICDSNLSELFVNIYKHSYHECNNCGHLYLKNPPTQEALSKMYIVDDSKENESIQGQIYLQKSLFKKRVNEIAKPKALFADELIDEKGKWIDIGAGVGDLVLALKELNWDVFGYESDKEEVKFARSMGVEIENKFLTNPDLRDILIDAKVVSTINVLEHLKEPKSFVCEISKNLKSGSYFLFEVPRFPSLSSFTNRCFPHLSARHIVSPDHLHIFSDNSMKILLKTANFSIISTWYFGQDIYELIGNAQCEGNFKDHHLVEKVLSIVNDLQLIVDKNSLSDTMLVLAQKN